MASRSKEKADAAIKELQQQTGKEAIFLELDLSNLASVRKAAEEYLRYGILTTMHDRNEVSRQRFAARRVYYMSCSITRASDKHGLDCTLNIQCRGVMWAPTELLTADGYDLQFGTNVVGKHSLLSSLLEV